MTNSKRLINIFDVGLNPIDAIEKLINEHGSAVILAQQLALAKDKYSALERDNAELQRENGKLDAKLEREQVDRHKAQTELTRLQKDHEEEVRIHRSVEFRRGRRTGGKWSAFCPKCHLPAKKEGEDIYTTCSDFKCAWRVNLENDSLTDLISELESGSR